jgi:hypothetical protein
MLNREYRCHLVVVVALQLLLLLEVLLPLLPRLRRKRRRKRRSAFSCFLPCRSSDLHFPSVQEESDDDMGFGLFD